MFSQSFRHVQWTCPIFSGPRNIGSNYRLFDVFDLSFVLYLLDVLKISLKYISTNMMNICGYEGQCLSWWKLVVFYGLKLNIKLTFISFYFYFIWTFLMFLRSLHFEIILFFAGFIKMEDWTCLVLLIKIFILK